jgi:hypothetical protein
MKDKKIQEFLYIKKTMINDTRFLSRNQKILRKSIEISIFIFAFYILKYTHFFNDNIFISIFSNIILFSLILIVFHGILYYYRKKEGV